VSIDSRRQLALPVGHERILLNDTEIKEKKPNNYKASFLEIVFVSLKKQITTDKKFVE
jgi:hypothetical protein